MPFWNAKLERKLKLREKLKKKLSRQKKGTEIHGATQKRLRLADRAFRDSFDGARAEFVWKAVRKAAELCRSSDQRAYHKAVKKLGRLFGKKSPPMMMQNVRGEVAKTV